MKKRIKAAVVGVGCMGEYHANVYYELPEVDLVAVVDLDEDKGAEIAHRYDTDFYRDYKELYGKVDIVSIAVPTSIHYEVGKDILEAGIHVLLEKPITDNMEEAVELFNLSEQKNLVLHIGHVERFNGAVHELKKIVTEPLMIESRRLGPYDPRIRDAGVVLDMMIHDIDIILNLVGAKVKTLCAIGQSVYTKHEDIANVFLGFDNNCTAVITASRATQNKIRTLAVSQKDKYIFLDYTNQDIHIHRRASSEHFLTKEELLYKHESFTERIFVHRDNPLKLEIKHLIDCVQNGAKRVVPIDDELYSLKISLDVITRLRQNDHVLRY